ncbi:hypothetical protein A1Q1_01842 [Trichosporon asahii var. asahii CBS 2479]|uniref:Uncharacterized protein n=1 Tax=Trichosporon asahii var. asahii (strain ATCC 90039 / CBS 2479 / JCM 2466 / KCTC 7840 / NBRC 103889/ NCYC 2677 / UAMH 7654) TaxID=1186058 RepID=J6FCJ2_TRIAS|nr:hypothetical protein A1Q1_01842 [Trichosporon asahii var. asahii CBS 2479]EJT52802.1 hypothetical protein A1Q1_01842 [Trichosporon asahii var. asahii CBS 2479]
MPPPPVPSRALTLHSTARASNSATHDVVDLTKPRPRTQEPSAAPSRKRSYSTFSIKTERSLSPRPSVKRERGERSESEWTVTPRRTPAVPPPRAPSHTRMPFRHASSVSTVGLNPPRPRVSRKNTESSSGGLGGQPAPEDLRHAVSQVRNKLETFGVLSDGEAGPALAALLGRLYDRSHLADESDVAAEGLLGILSSVMLQVLSMAPLHLVTSWSTTKIGLKAQISTKAPSDGDARTPKRRVEWEGLPPPAYW